MLDGTPDPVEWTRTNGDAKKVPFSIRLGSADATAKALGFFLDSCQSAGDDCAFASTDTRGKFDTMMARLLQQPVTVETPDGPIDVSYGFLVDGCGRAHFPADLGRSGRPARAGLPSDRGQSAERRGQVSSDEVGRPDRGLRQLERGAPLHRLLGQHQSAQPRGVAEAGRRRRCPRAVLRSRLGLPRAALRDLARPRPRPLHRSVHDEDGEPALVRQLALRCREQLRTHAGARRLHPGRGFSPSMEPGTPLRSSPTRASTTRSPSTWLARRRRRRARSANPTFRRSWRAINADVN